MKRWHRLPWGDEHVQQSSVVNITHVDPTLAHHSVRVPEWLLFILVGLSTIGVALLIGLLAFMK